MGSPVSVVIAEIVMQHVEEGANRQGAVYKLRSNAPTTRTIVNTIQTNVNVESCVSLPLYIQTMKLQACLSLERLN